MMGPEMILGVLLLRQITVGIKVALESKEYLSFTIDIFLNMVIQLVIYIVIYKLFHSMLIICF